MRNLRLQIEYDGTNYCGWQRQSPQAGKKSIQETIEKALQKILQEKIHLIGSGRTDAGVHALAQVANFQTNSAIAPEKLQKALNALLPEDISIAKVAQAKSNFHSRFACRSKVYRYTILNRKHPSPFLRKSAYFYRYPLDTKLMQAQARVLLGRHNFASFQTQDIRKREAVRRIKKIEITKDKDIIHIDIEADGFLYNMARSIAGTLLEVARGRFPKGALKKILASRNRKMAGPTLPACGLCLLQVKY